MQELVSHCIVCNKQIYCYDGFINGIVLGNGSLECFDCSFKEQVEPENNKMLLNEEVKLMSNRNPIGIYQENEEITNEQINLWINDLIRTPDDTKKLVSELTMEQLETPFRENGWTLKRIMHHIADANMNSYIHFKLALTEENPVIKPYFEDRWVELHDEKNQSLETSLLLLKSIIGRWESLLRSMVYSQFNKTFVHPLNGQKKLDQYLGFCVWHNKHHLAQIKNLLRENDWD